MIMVAGATGYLGGEICRRLRDRGYAVRGLVRETADPETVGRLQALGVELAVGDLRDRASLDAACAGAHTVITTATATRSRQPGDGIEATDRDGQLNLVAAAQAAGVGRYIYTSFSSQIGGDDPITRAKRSVERAVRDSGMTWTILRPSCFMEVWLSPHLGFDYTTGSVTIYGDGTQPLSWISLGDVAEFAVRSCDNAEAENAALELGGPEPLPPIEVVRIFEQAAGRRFQVQHVSVETLGALKAAAADSLEESFAALMLAYAAGDPIDMTATFRRFGFVPTAVRDYALSVCRDAPVLAS